MCKKIVLLLLLYSNCFANKPVVCSNITQELNPQIVEMITNICNSNDFNKNIRFITNTTNVDVDTWIKKAFFIIIDKKSNIVLSPYNNVFRNIAIQPNASIINYRNFIKLSSSQKLPNYNWLQQVNNISYLISSDVNSINNMFSNTLDSNLPQDTASSITDNAENNNFLVTTTIKNSTSGVATCNNIDHNLNLMVILIMKNMCNSSYINNNTRFITDTNNVVVDDWIAKGFFVIFNKKFNTLVLPYNNIFKQIAILPSAKPYDYHKLFSLSVEQNQPKYKWLQKVNNTSSLIKTKTFLMFDMFDGYEPYSYPTSITQNPFIIDTDIESNTRYIIVGALLSIATIASIVAFVSAKIYKKRSRRLYTPI